MEKIPIYAKIDSDVRDRAMMYITKNKLSGGKLTTMSALVEEAVDAYMISNPILQSQN